VLRPILETWRDAYDAAVPVAARSSWRPDRQERSFSMQAPGAPTLIAGDDRSGDLDWWSFDAEPHASLGAAAAGTSTTITAVPRLAHYVGMPVTRFWQYEDAGVSFGEVTVDPHDLGRLLLIEFALAGADDWHVVPLPLSVGAVATVAQLRVVDTFGRTTDIAPVDDGPDPANAGSGGAGGADRVHWRMYRISSGEDDALPLPLIAPTSGAVQIGDPIEDVRLARDEQANLGWAIAATTPDGRGAGVGIDPGPVSTEPRPVAPATRAYIVQTGVPAGWVPLIPQPTTAGGLELARGTFAADPGAGPAGTLVPEIIAVREELLPRDGLTVVRRWRYARWIDGSIHAWIGRDVQTGAGEPESKLAFDRLV